jgi:hypothetical protein
MVRDLNWTGGGELEMVRDPSNKLWLLEMNPRFPAWVHGSTIAGENLPAMLVERATGIARRAAPAQSAEFTRLVVEIPVRADFPLPPLAEPFALYRPLKPKLPCVPNGSMTQPPPVANCPELT